ncbi:hypothetical protein E2979_06970 [Paracoccus yeei]
MIKWLSQAQDHHSHRPEWSIAENDLTVPFRDKIAIHDAWREYEALVRSRTNAATIAFVQGLNEVVRSGVDQANNKMHLLDIVLPKARSLVATWHPGSSDFLVKAAILYELQR